VQAGDLVVVMRTVYVCRSTSERLARCCGSAAASAGQARYWNASKRANPTPDVLRLGEPLTVDARANNCNIVIDIFSSATMPYHTRFAVAVHKLAAIAVSGVSLCALKTLRIAPIPVLS